MEHEAGPCQEPVILHGRSVSGSTTETMNLGTCSSGKNTSATTARNHIAKVPSAIEEALANLTSVISALTPSPPPRIVEAMRKVRSEVSVHLRSAPEAPKVSDHSAPETTRRDSPDASRSTSPPPVVALEANARALKWQRYYSKNKDRLLEKKKQMYSLLDEAAKTARYRKNRENYKKMVTVKLAGEKLTAFRNKQNERTKAYMAKMKEEDPEKFEQLKKRNALRARERRAQLKKQIPGQEKPETMVPSPRHNEVEMSFKSSRSSFGKLRFLRTQVGRIASPKEEEAETQKAERPAGEVDSPVATPPQGEINNSEMDRNENRTERTEPENPPNEFAHEKESLIATPIPRIEINNSETDRNGNPSERPEPGTRLNEKDFQDIIYTYYASRKH